MANTEAHPVRVLVVEEEGMNSPNIQAIVSGLGYKVSSSRAEVVAESEDRAPDLILIDVGSGLGREVIRRAKSLAQKHHIPIVYFSTQAAKAA